MAASRRDPESSKTRRPPAATPEARENQMIALAVDLAEKQLLDGSASSQVLTHYLKLSSGREKLEREKLRNENLLLETRVEALASGARMEELYSEAINAMRQYGGQDIPDHGDE